MKNNLKLFLINFTFQICSMSSEIRRDDRKTSQMRPGQSQASVKRSADGKAYPTSAKVRINKTLGSICYMTASVYFMVLVLFYSTKICLAQNVIFSNEKMSFHSERHVISQRVINAEISKTIEMIETATKNYKKGIALPRKNKYHSHRFVRH